MIRSQLTPSVPLMLLLACSACAPAGERVAPVAPPASSAAKPEALPAQTLPTDRGLPALPKASGSGHPGGRYATLPEPARQGLGELKWHVGSADQEAVGSLL